MYEMRGLVESGDEPVMCRRSKLAWQVVDGGGSMASHFRSSAQEQEIASIGTGATAGVVVWERWPCVCLVTACALW